MQGLLAALILVFSSITYAQSRDLGGGGFNIGATQSRRSSERFNILDWIRSQQAAVRAQDAKYGRAGGGGPGPYPDLTLTYWQDQGDVTRQSTKLGKTVRNAGRVQFLLDDLFRQGNKTRTLNIDLGFEAFLSQTNQFTPEPSITQQTHKYSEMGGGVALRPIGRSSQDTGLLLKAGYVHLDQTGLWSNTQSPISMYATYVGAEAKLYLLPFLGGRAEYFSTLETEIGSLNSKWKMQKFTYGAFLEIFLINLEAHLFSHEFVLTEAATANSTKEIHTGIGFAGSLHF
ncbi:MAG: hypothetical protein IT289_03675 [Oligoflexia bacterium]|nr:hypothetical protein [Oligoflexia bacterium]